MGGSLEIEYGGISGSTSKNAITRTVMFCSGVILLAALLFGLLVAQTGPSSSTMTAGKVTDSSGNVVYLPAGSDLLIFQTNSEKLMFGAIATLGCLVGALSGGTIIELIGIRYCVMCTIPFYVAGWLMIGLGTNIATLYSARVFVGLAVGINAVSAPTYLGEIAPLALRGLFGALHQLAITTGILLGYALVFPFQTNGGQALPDGETPFVNWRGLSLVNLAPTGLLAVLVFFIQESPRWLAKKGKTEAAASALRALRGSAVTETELEELNKTSQSRTESTADEKSFSLSDIAGAWKQIGLGAALQILQQFVGINVIMFYGTDVLQSANVPNKDLYAVMAMLEQVIMTALGCYLMDKAGRRVLLMISSFFIGAACYVLGAYLYVSQSNHDLWPLAVFSMYLYLAAYSIGVGPIPWLILSEIIPDKVRGVGSGIATASNWTCAFIITLTTSSIADGLTPYGMWWFYGGMSFVLFFFSTFLIPETKGKTFAEIQKAFQ